MKSFKVLFMIERLLDDRQAAHAFGKRGREIFEESFTLERSLT
jgi:hypothetical protein